MIRKSNLFTIKNFRFFREEHMSPLQPARDLRSIRSQKEWNELIAVYLYLSVMGAGSFVIGTLIGWLGAKLNPPFLASFSIVGVTLNFSRVPMLWGPIMVALG